jgi:hypothetical protein
VLAITAIAAILLSSCASNTNTTPPPAKFAEREKCPDAALNSGVATLNELGDDASRNQRVQTVVVLDVTKATDVEARSLAARCFLRGAMSAALTERTTHEYSYVFLGRNRGEFIIESLVGDEVGRATRNALATTTSATDEAAAATRQAWGEILAGQISPDLAECSRQIRPSLFGLGIDGAEFDALADSLCAANEKLATAFTEISQATAEAEAGSDVYGTLDMIDDEYAKNELDLLRIVAFSDLLDFNPNTDSNLTKELTGKTKAEAIALGETKGLRDGGFKSGRVIIYAEQPGETAGGTQRAIRPLVQEFWQAYAKSRGAEITQLTNLANAR